VRQSCVIGEVIDTYDINAWVCERGTEEVAANTSKTIDSDISHYETSFES
jgi:hypothetical protein